MDQPRLLRMIEDLEGLLLGNQSTKAALSDELGHGTEKHARILRLIAGPAQQLPPMPTVADANGYAVSIANILRRLVIGVNVNPGRYLLFHCNHPGEGEGRYGRRSGSLLQPQHCDIEVLEEAGKLFGAVVHLTPHELHFEDPGEKRHQAVVPDPLAFAGEDQPFVSHGL